MHSIIHKKRTTKKKKKKKKTALGKTENPDPGTILSFLFPAERSLRFFGLTSVSGCHPSQDPRHEVPFPYPFYHLDRSLISRFISGYFLSSFRSFAFFL
ncbi:hypothetical protein CEXT_24681 [Caerostris extrusa]|uniref:Uncharacterized protein n=1 Tax=Caerostris extrusa TaxID=172846 RepID=A0AAV4V8N4_CAEEX|nr:hypothetical protein CEXT_24681 [Caerostris extrusa]